MSGDDPTVDPHEATTPSARERREDLPRGSHIARYEITRLVGRGGMGAVYAGYDPQLARPVAIKLLHPGSHVPRDALVDEAKALARLDDPHVIRVFDAGYHGDDVFIAMQLVDGDDLRTAVAAREPSIAQRIAWYVDAGRGLAAAHAAGLVHRDFKPDNVLVASDGRVAVTDFGLAIDVDAATERARFAGTPLYMAPERHALEPATAASDQFSFCVAMWEALFGRHPYVSREGDPPSMFAVARAITEGPLIPAPPRVVPRRIVRALERGLARRPDDRWPNMTALVGELARPAWLRPRTIGAVAGVVAVAIAVTWLVASRSPDPAAACRDAWTERLATAWPAARRAAVAERAAAIDSYAARWSAIAAESCTIDDASRDAMRACLDASVDRLRAVVEVLAGDPAEVAHHERDVIASLPDLADCTDRAALAAAPDRAPPGAHELTAALDDIVARQATDSPHTLDRARELVAKADALGWAPGIARAHLALGRALALAYEPALDELVRGAELAGAAHLDRDAVTGWTFALGEAGYESKSDALDTLVTAARTAAARTRDAGAMLDVDIAYARALIPSQRWDEALSICRAAIDKARVVAPRLLDPARDCVFEGLLPAGKLDELHQVATQRVASTTERLGPDAPQLATYYSVLADSDAAHGDTARARDEIDRALAVIHRAYPDGKNLKVAEVLRVRATVEAAEGRAQASLATLREALAIATAIVPKPIVVLVDIQTGIAMALMQRQDFPAAIATYEAAIAMARTQSSQSLSLAMLLLDYGQLAGGADPDAGIRAFGEARAIFEHRHDPRAAYASAALAIVESQHAKWQDARIHAEEAVAFAATDPNAVPANTAILRFVLAEALVETHGDRKRALELAHTARSALAALGPATNPQVAAIDQWLAAH